GPRVALGSPCMADGGGTRGGAALEILPRPRETADPGRIPLGGPAEEAVPEGTGLSLHVDRGSEGGPRRRPGGQQDRRFFPAADLHPLCHPRRTPCHAVLSRPPAAPRPAQKRRGRDPGSGRSGAHYTNGGWHPAGSSSPAPGGCAEPAPLREHPP